MRYICENERRRQALNAHPTLNGIDYLEVLDEDAPPGSPPQRTLLVRFLKALPAGLSAANVQIDGGVRVTPVAVEWVGVAAGAAALFAAGRINAHERDFLLAQPQPDRLLVVRTDSTGDYATYRLRLVTSPTQPAPPPGFDVVLSAIYFSFKVECPSDFDCRQQVLCPPEPEIDPGIDLMAKDYASFRQLILDRLAVIMPEWQERNPADLGIALVELLAYAGDYLSYYQDAAATEAYLGTARRRSSLRRHARLLDYPMHDGCNARAWVALAVDAGGDGLYLPAVDPIGGAPTRLLTRVPEGVVIAEARLEQVLAAHDAEVFELAHDLRLYEAHNLIALYTWGDENCCLPRGATRATLQDDPARRLRLRPGDVLIFEERLSPATGLEADADAAHRHAVRLTRVEPAADVAADGSRTPGPLRTDELTGQAIVEVAWDQEDALTFPLCLSAVIDGSLVTDISMAVGNVALCDHGRTVAGETLPAPAGHLRYRPRLQSASGRATAAITNRAPYPPANGSAPPAAHSLRQDPQKALPAVELRAEGETWLPQRDLLNSDRFAAEFVVETESDGRAYVRFGDGVYGRQPPVAAASHSRFRIGNGRGGNVGAEAIAHLVTDLGGVAGAIAGLRNPMPAWGGTDPESLEEVRQYAPQAFRTQERAVTEADYAAVAGRHSQVSKAMASRRWTGSWYTMFVTVDRKGGRPITPAFEAELREFMERFRLAGHDLEIDGPKFVPLDIVITVCVQPGFFRSQVKQDLLERFSGRDLAGGRRGFFHPDNFTFGQPVYLSQIVAAAMQAPGVQWVDADDAGGKPNRFRRWGEDAHGEIQAGAIHMARLEIARLDNDPSLPENGRIDFIMEGGL